MSASARSVVPALFRDRFGVVTRVQDVATRRDATRRDATRRDVTGKEDLTGVLPQLARTYGTPTYIYDLDRVSQQVSALREAFLSADLVDIHYAVKANPCGAVLRHLAGQKLGAEVITLGELERALRAGFSPEHLLLGGPKQDDALRYRAVQAGVKLVSLDSVSQWEMWQQDLKNEEVNMRFLVRLNPALDPRTHEHLATGAAESKFGMTLEEAQEVAGALGDTLAGFHVHAGSQISDMSVYDEIFAVLKPLYERFPKADTLDLGGGFAVPDFPLERFAQKVSAFLKGLGVRLILEPGRYLTAESGVLLTQGPPHQKRRTAPRHRRRRHGGFAPPGALRRGASDSRAHL